MKCGRPKIKLKRTCKEKEEVVKKDQSWQGGRVKEHHGCIGGKGSCTNQNAVQPTAHSYNEPDELLRWEYGGFLTVQIIQKWDCDYVFSTSTFSF